MSIPLTVENLYGGGVVERVHAEIRKAIANIVDLNTPAKKPRVVTLKITIKPNESRNLADVTVATSSTLQAPQPIETSIQIGHDPRTGEVGAEEIVKGENYMQNTLPGTMQKGNIVQFNKAINN